MLYVLDPALSAAPPEPAREFLDAARPLLNLGKICERDAVDDLAELDPTGEDGVVFFNPPTDAAREALGKLVERAHSAGAVVLPIALDAEQRSGVPGVPELNPFDVRQRLRGRDLTDNQLATVAQDFARLTLSRLQPTYHKDRLRIFLSYRRADAEDLGARIVEALSDRHKGHVVFFDLEDIPAGEDFRPRIDEELQTADVLVVLDTPTVGRSTWIKYEVKTALGKRVPVVPVRLGTPADGEREELGLQLARSKKLIRPSLELADAEVQRLAGEILDVAFERALSHVRTSQRALRTLKDWANAHEADMEVLDARQLIYLVRHPVAERRYPTRRATDVLQLFGRFATEHDRDALEERLRELDMGPHGRQCRAFDAAFLLDPRAGHPRQVGEWAVFDHPDRFLASVQARAVPDEFPPLGPRLLLLGSYPSSDAAHDEVFAAVRAVAVTWLGLGGAIVFGGHPEFVPIVLEAMRRTVPGRGKERVTVFQSEWFPDAEDRKALELEIAVRPTPRLETRDASLTRMREEMIAFGADAVVAIGGRTVAERERPGIEEEIDLARGARMPVYLLGAVGGQTAVRANRERETSPPWSGLANPLTAEDNERLRVDDAYEDAARLIWSHTPKDGD
jgi:hypothetical protein